jgi:hypothetical protein
VAGVAVVAEGGGGALTESSASGVAVHAVSSPTTAGTIPHRILMP